MNFCKRSYQPILRYLYTETIKRSGKISLHKPFNTNISLHPVHFFRSKDFALNSLPSLDTAYNHSISLNIPCYKTAILIIMVQYKCTISCYQLTSPFVRFRGFVRYKRRVNDYRPAKKRLRDWNEIYSHPKEKELKVQTARSVLSSPCRRYCTSFKKY